VTQLVDEHGDGEAEDVREYHGSDEEGETFKVGKLKSDGG
jgi:hypothetical protein